MRISHSMREINETGVKKVRNAWVVFFMHPFYTRLIWFFANFTKISPNQVTFFSFLLTISSAVSFWNGNLILGALLYELGLIFDAVDGGLARVTGRSSKIGNLLDNLADRIRPPLLITTLTLYLFFATDNWHFILWGFLYMGIEGLLPVLYLKSYELNEKKLLTNVLSKKNLFGRIHQFFADRGVKIAYDNVETDTIIFFITPLVAGIIGNYDFVLYAFILGTAMLSLLFIVFLTLQWKATVSVQNQTTRP